MPARVRIFTYGGVPLDEVNAEVRRAWTLNRYGKAVLTIAKTDPKLIERNFTEGNLVLVEHDKLGAWGGVMDTPQEWRQDSLQQTCYSAEYLLSFRVGPKDLTLTGTAGAIFEKMVSLANQAADTRIRAGDIYKGGTQRQQALHFDSLYDITVQLSDRSANDWSLEPKLDAGGMLYFSANWYNQKGVTQPLELWEGQNLELERGVILTRQGKIINDLFGFGDGATWHNRQYSEAQDTASAYKYGLRQAGQNFSGVSLATVKTSAESTVTAQKNPRRTYRLTAADVGETFYRINTGDVLPLTLVKHGFTSGGLGTKTTVRVKAREYSEIGNTVDLVVDEL